jgi:hypothetical protein
MKAVLWLVAIAVLLCGLCKPEPVHAQGRVAAARAAAEFIVERFGAQAAREGLAVLASRIEGMAARHGDEVFQAIRKCGPQFFKVVEEAGVDNAGRAVRIMAEHGEGGVAWVLKRPRALALLAQHGEEAAAVLVKIPGGICEPLIEQCGGPAIKALQAVGPQGGRRLAMLLGEGGELTMAGRSAELLGVVGTWGEKGCEFLWKHKGALCTATILTAFLAQPEAFISGARDISEIVAQNAVKPIAEIPGQVAREAAKEINWTFVAVVFLVVAAGLVFALVTVLPWCRAFIGQGLASVSGGAALHVPPPLPPQAILLSQSPESTDLPHSVPQSVREPHGPKYQGDSYVQ